MTSNEKMLFATMIFIVGMSVGGILSDKGNLDRCKKYGATPILFQQIKCEVVEGKV